MVKGDIVYHHPNILEALEVRVTVFRIPLNILKSILYPLVVKKEIGQFHHKSPKLHKYPISL